MNDSHMSILKKALILLFFQCSIVVSPMVLAGTLPVASEGQDTQRFTVSADSVRFHNDSDDQNSKASKSNSKKAPEKKCVKLKAVKKKSPWAGSQLNLGIVVNTGNTRTTNIDFASIINFSKGSWNNNTQATAQWGSDTGVLTKEKYYLQNQLNYLFNGKKKNYIFFNTTGTIDEFSPYVYQVIVTAGYGRELIKTKHFYLRLQSGPGYRRNEQRATSLISRHQSNNLVLSSQAFISWQITKSGAFTEQLRYDIGSPYDYLRSVTAFTNEIIHNLAAQVAFTVDYYSSIPPGSTRSVKTDTTTSISLVYNF